MAKIIQGEIECEFGGGPLDDRSQDGTSNHRIQAVHL